MIHSLHVSLRIPRLEESPWVGHGRNDWHTARRKCSPKRGTGLLVLTTTAAQQTKCLLAALKIACSRVISRRSLAAALPHTRQPTSATAAQR